MARAKGITHTQILASLKKKDYSPVYLLVGEEGYYIDLISSFIEKNVLTESETAFNLSVLYGRDITPTQVADTARQYPMMASHRVVIVKEAQGLKNLAQLSAYAENPSPQTILVICYKHGKPDGRSKGIQVLKAKSIYFESNKIRDYQLGSWISKEVSDRSYTIAPQTAEMLAQYLGADLSKITNELDKLTLNLAKGTSISPKVIESKIGISKDYNIFEFQNALGARNKIQAYRIAQYFDANPKKNSPMMILPGMYSYFMKVYLANTASSIGDADLAKRIGVPFFQNILNGYKLAARNYSVQSLKKIFYSLRQADLHAKGVGKRNSQKGLITELTYRVLNS